MWIAAGPDTVEITARPKTGGNWVNLTFYITVGAKTERGISVDLPAGTAQNVTVITDFAKHQLEAHFAGKNAAVGTLANSGPIRVYQNGLGARGEGASLSASVERTGQPTLCQSLVSGSSTRAASSPGS